MRSAIRPGSDQTSPRSGLSLPQSRAMLAHPERSGGMAKFVFGMNVSLDGYVDHQAFSPDTVLFRHWIDQVRRATAGIYGRRIYEIMRYWDEDQPGWTQPKRDFAHAWRRLPKWVVSRSRPPVGPNAPLFSKEIEAVVRGLKANLVGEVDVCGTLLAHTLTNLGLIDEYRLYLHPMVLGQGTPFFAEPHPRLRLLTSDKIGDDVVRLLMGQSEWHLLLHKDAGRRSKWPFKALGDVHGLPKEAARRRKTVESPFDGDGHEDAQQHDSGRNLLPRGSTSLNAGAGDPGAAQIARDTGWLGRRSSPQTLP